MSLKPLKLRYRTGKAGKLHVMKSAWDPSRTGAEHTHTHGHRHRHTHTHTHTSKHK